MRRYSGYQRIPLVEYIRLYHGQTEWTAWYEDIQIQRVETIDPQHYRLHLADGQVVKVKYSARVRVYRPPLEDQLPGDQLQQNEGSS